MKIINGYAEKILITSSVLITILCAYIFYAMVIDGELLNRPVTYWPGCFTSTKSVYGANDDIKLRVIATKHRPIVGSVMWQMVSVDSRQVVAQFLARPTVLGEGFHDYSIKVGEVPVNTPDGKFFMRGMVVFPINPLKDITYTLQSDVFEVQNGANHSG